jgi:hypothetical protein
MRFPFEPLLPSGLPHGNEKADWNAAIARDATTTGPKFTIMDIESRGRVPAVLDITAHQSEFRLLVDDLLARAQRCDQGRARSGTAGGAPRTRVR